MTREPSDDEKRVDELLTRAKKFGKMTLGDVEKLIERQEVEIERLTVALQGMVDEWDKLTRYGSPMAKAANERVSAARAALEPKP